MKIGISIDPDRRVRQLQTGHPARLRVFHYEQVTVATARELERLLHRDLAHLRRRGEWFDLTVANAILHIQYTIIRYGDEVGLDVGVVEPVSERHTLTSIDGNVTVR